MAIKPQVMAAISGAIAAYLADEEAMQAAAMSLALAAPAGPPVNLWALAGRQEFMNLRQLVQRRSLK